MKSNSLNLISELKIILIRPHCGLIGFVSFVFSNSFYFGSIAIYTRPAGGWRLVYPTRKVDSKSFNVFYPINRQIADELEKLVSQELQSLNSQEEKK